VSAAPRHGEWRRRVLRVHHGCALPPSALNVASAPLKMIERACSCLSSPLWQPQVKTQLSPGETMVRKAVGLLAPRHPLTRLVGATMTTNPPLLLR
jgi:hypothetical protein